MKFLSTRGKDVANNSAEAITKGLAGDGGLFVPERFPDFSAKLKDMVGMEYYEISAKVISSYLEEYPYDELLNECKKAYAQFDGEPAPIVKLDDDLFVCELFHGPTLAFKDIALTLLPYLLRKGSDISGVKEQILVLVATSGDTGKAALEGFKNAKGIKINVFYPSDGVSEMQKLQMCTQEGDNVNVVGVKGNFDDCQNAVKKIFSSKECNRILNEKGIVLSSANSINFGRLVPQIAYYFSSYLYLVNDGVIRLGDKISFTVPTGNFGNILAGYYAKQMGLPIDRLICASNSNNVLTEFFTNGEYDANREFYKTVSPSMDILISSNLERLVFEISGRDAVKTSERMAELKEKGKYDIEDKELKQLAKDFSAGYSEEEECTDTIGGVFDEYGYLTDTHTAVALKVTNDYREIINGKIVVLSTASPYKFAKDVLKAITDRTVKDPFKASEALYNESAVEIPPQISGLKTKEKRFTTVVEREKTFDEVLNFISK